MDVMLPVFTYGTLRPGQPNHRIVATQVRTATPARLDGYAMYGRGFGFPYITPSKGHTVAGDLLHFAPAAYREVMSRLDGLEGFQPGRSDNHYDRARVAVRLPSGASTDAWVYLAGVNTVRRLRGRDELIIADGDWLNEVLTHA
jgi:gamma-glutamylcyclotransferase (GGCT)/AIG2-like uncharacterized protein YtfP